MAQMEKLLAYLETCQIYSSEERKRIIEALIKLEDKPPIHGFIYMDVFNDDQLNFGSCVVVQRCCPQIDALPFGHNLSALGFPYIIACHRNYNYFGLHEEGGEETEGWVATRSFTRLEHPLFWDDIQRIVTEAVTV